MSLTINRNQLTPQTQRYLLESAKALKNYRIKSAAIGGLIITVMAIAITVFATLAKNSTAVKDSLEYNLHQLGILCSSSILIITFFALLYILKRHPMPLKSAASRCQVIRDANNLNQFVYQHEIPNIIAFGIIEKRHEGALKKIYADYAQAYALKQKFERLPAILQNDSRLSAPHTIALAKVEADFQTLLPTLKAELPDPVSLMAPDGAAIALLKDPESTASAATEDFLGERTSSSSPSIGPDAATIN